MKKTDYLTLNIRGSLMSLKIPKVMGILNVTPDSFYSGSRNVEEDKIRKRVREIISEGADIIDVGGCSTRPGSEPPTEEEELRRIELGCRIIREINPDIPLSIDTFRANVARSAIIEYNADIINDVSGGCDPTMWETVKEYNKVYILTHNGESLSDGPVVANLITDLSKKASKLHSIGVNDVIIDPGFGFCKSIAENFIIFDSLNEVARMGLPVMVGLSRKSMIYKTLGITPEESLCGTVALNALALEKGADILRVHDVKEAVETVKLFSKLKEKGE